MNLLKILEVEIALKGDNALEREFLPSVCVKKEVKENEKNEV